MMSGTPAPEERATALVVVKTHITGGPWYIELAELLPQPVAIGPYDNPSVAEEIATRMRAFLAALIRDERQSAGGEPV